MDMFEHRRCVHVHPLTHVQRVCNGFKEYSSLWECLRLISACVEIDTFSLWGDSGI